MRSKFGLVVVTVLVAVLLPVHAFATEPFAKVGTFAMQFLKIPPSARGTGMGSAFTALANDASATYWNPGGIVEVTNTAITLEHTVWPADVNLDFAAAVFTLPFDPKDEAYDRSVMAPAVVTSAKQLRVYSQTSKGRSSEIRSSCHAP